MTEPPPAQPGMPAGKASVDGTERASPGLHAGGAPLRTPRTRRRHRVPFPPAACRRRRVVRLWQSRRPPATDSHPFAAGAGGNPAGAAGGRPARAPRQRQRAVRHRHRRRDPGGLAGGRGRDHQRHPRLLPRRRPGPKAARAGGAARSGRRRPPLYLVGASMGGLGVLLYDQAYPGVADGLVLLAPFVGSRRLLAEIERAGGIGQWQPGPVPESVDRGNFQRELWRHLKSWPDSGRGDSVWLAWGDRDRLRRAVPVLAPLLRGEQMLERPGGMPGACGHRHPPRSFPGSRAATPAPAATCADPGPRLPSAARRRRANRSLPRERRQPRGTAVPAGGRSCQGSALWAP